MVLIPGQQAPLGEQIDGGLKDIETPVCSEVMETVPRIAALHVQAECLAYTVGTPLMRMAKNAVFILSGEHGVVIIGVLIERSCSGKVGDDRPVDLATLHTLPALFACIAFLPLALTPKIITTMVIVVPLGGFGLVGISDDSLTRWLSSWWRWRKRRRLMLYRGEAKN